MHRRGRKPDPDLRRRLLGVIWMLTFGGMQWRLAGLLSGIAFTTLHSAFARWTRLGLWRRLGQRLALDWRVACGDEALPSALVVDSRSQRSSPTCFTRGIDGGKNIKGIKLHVVCDKHGSLIDLEVTPANTTTVPASCRCCPASPNSASRATCSATAATRAHLSPRPPSTMTSRSRSPPAEQPTAGSFPWHPLGGRAPVRLVVPLSPPQHRIRPKGRSLCRPCLDRHQLDPGALASLEAKALICNTFNLRTASYEHDRCRTRIHQHRRTAPPPQG